MKISSIILCAGLIMCTACVEGSSASAQGSNQQKVGTSIVSVDSIYVPLAAGLRVEGESAKLLYGELTKYIAPVIDTNSGSSSIVGKNIACSLQLETVDGQKQSKYWCGLIVQVTDGSTEPDSLVGGNPKVGGGN